MFVIDSYKSLLPDSAGNTVILLAQISQQLDGLANGTLASKGSSSSLLQSNRKPPSSVVWVNALWFLSLVISLFCALLATLQQRWARRYLQLTQPQLAIHKRALIRSFFAEGVTNFHLDVAVEAIPALLHVSVFLFLTGLVISLFNIHHTVAYVVLAGDHCDAGHLPRLSIHISILGARVVYLSEDSPGFAQGCGFRGETYEVRQKEHNAPPERRQCVANQCVTVPSASVPKHDQGCVLCGLEVGQWNDCPSPGLDTR